MNSKELPTIHLFVLLQISRFTQFTVTKMAFKFIILFGFLATANAGDLSHGYIGYAPTIQKTIEYAAPVAPVTKTIYQSSPVIAKSYYEPEYNYHAHAPAAAAVYTEDYPPNYSHGTVSHHAKTIATPHSYVNKYNTQLIHDDHHNVHYPTIIKSPIVPAIVKAPVIAAHAVPTIVKSHPIAAIAAPIVKHYDSYDHSYGHAYDHSYDHSYAHAAAPVITKAALSYSPAEAVSHTTFESSHGNYAW